ncbi:hypothetical protein [Rhizobium giardinii]|uniref:hypothetical protein n=1 Tax=Rhizobium giardinii TaxID=56731 RepID=UPI003D7009D4
MPSQFNGIGGGVKRLISEVKIGDCVIGYEAVRSRARKSKWNHFQGRLAEIEKLMHHRHGPLVPETDDALIYAEVIASLSYVEFGQEFVSVVLAWSAKWLPWARKADIEEIIYDRTKVRFSPLTADALGHALHVSFTERCALDLRTIGSFDFSKRERSKLQKQKRQEHDRERKSVQRRAAGALTRIEYLEKSHSRSRPWEFFGVCRRTWENRGKPEPVDYGRAE